MQCLVNHDPCMLTRYGLAYHPKSPLYDLINLSILEMRETGLLQMLHRKWWHDRAQCPQGDTEKVSIWATFNEAPQRRLGEI